MSKKTGSLLILFVCLFIAGACYAANADAAESGTAEWVRFPYHASAAKSCTYLYVVGGYHSVDNGCPAWGSADPANVRFIGDSMGDMVVTYEDGTKEKIPLIFGYTMWYYQTWQEASMPFRTAHADPELTELLKSSLHLLGAFEGSDTCVFRLKVQEKPIQDIQIEDNREKEGTPVFTGAFMVSGSVGELSEGTLRFHAQDPFFDSHTIDSDSLYPDSVKEALQKISYALITYESDYQDAPDFAYPAGYTGSRVHFTGSPIAEIASGVVYHNLMNLMNRTDADGFMHTSYKDAPSWRYDGFGFWVPAANSYYDSFYARDGARGIMSLNTYGLVSKARDSVMNANKWMMYFPENNMTFMGENVPGHYTVIVNKPLIYSTVLVPDANWPTRYTKEKFGDDYQNLGNQETDGHGLMMLANYNVWKSHGGGAQWVNDNWRYINEAAEWILWCFDHPELSFASNGLLYAESEAGMMEFTLYCNVACCLGMYGYGEMAETAGKTAEAAAWKECADMMKAGIDKRFRRGEGNRWSVSGFGFYHDPVVTMMSDFFGYDLGEMFPEWVAASRNTYAADIEPIAGFGYFGATGIGYNHSMITQNALLLDQMHDATKLVENLSKLSYAPRLPEPYLVPEGIAVDAERGMLRRQGDLGNLVQLSEALKCYAITVGLSPVKDGTLKIMPRLPETWNLDIQDFALQNAEGQADMLVSYPKNGVQTAQLTLDQTDGLNEVKFRFGPLPADTACAAVQVNGVNTACELVTSGDSAWVWVTLAPRASEEQKLALVYGDSVETLPSWPTEWATQKPGTIMTEPGTRNGMPAWIIAAVCATVAAAGAVSAAVIVKKRKHSS